MSTSAWPGALVFAGCLGTAAASVAADGLRPLDPYANHDVWVANDFISDPSPILGLLYADVVRVDDSSSPPLGSVRKLYDANPGSLANPAGSFLAFDGPRAVVDLAIPAWRKPGKFAFTALELASEPASAHMQFVGEAGVATPLALARRILERRGNLARVEYSTASGLALGEGHVRLDYTARGLSSARLGEVVVDDIGLPAVPPHPGVSLQDGKDWLERFGLQDCPAIRARFEEARNGSTRDVLRALLGRLDPAFTTRVLYWRAVRNEGERSTTHSLVLQVDTTGNVLIDLVRAWLVVPDHGSGKVPLVILPQQGHVYGALEALGVLGERELGMARELARHGVASLAFDSMPFGVTGMPYQRTYYQYYPNSGSTAKDLDNLRRLLDEVSSVPFQARAGFRLDTQRVGIWGFSYGAWISMLAPVMDGRIRAVAFSAFHYHDRDILPGLSSSLYIPQLACLDASGPPPLSVPKILREYKRPALAVVPDPGLLDEWVAGLDDKRVRVVINPYGHVVTESERALVLNFFYRTFGIAARAEPRGVAHALPDRAEEMAPFVARENRWRTELIKAMSAK